MSRAAQDWAARRVYLDPAIRWTLWHLADFASPEGVGAFPSVATLADETGISERTVQRHLRELETYRYIERGDGHLVSHIPYNRRPIVWNLRCQPGQPNGLSIVAELPSMPQSGLSTATMTPGGKPVDNTLPGVTRPSPPRGDTEGHSGVTRMSPNPRTNKEQKRARARTPLCRDCDSGWLLDPETKLPIARCPCRKGQTA